MPRLLPNNVLTGSGRTSSAILSNFLGEDISVTTVYGAPTDNTSSAKSAFQNAIDDLCAAGGGRLTAPGGYIFNIEDGLEFPDAGDDCPIELDLGDSMFLRTADAAVGKGFLNVLGKNVRLRRMKLELDVTTPTPLLYSDFAGDPLDPLLTLNTAVWVHAGAHNFVRERVVTSHTGGYACLANADTGDILNYREYDCEYLNCRPHLFGTSFGDRNYGSWTGGVLMHGNGLTGQPYMVRGAQFIRPRFRRVNGNCLWSHLYGFDSYHENFLIIGADGEDLGLDFILVGGVKGHRRQGCHARRVGYVTVDDSSPSVPKRLAGLWGTAYDHGFCEQMTCIGDEAVSCNGEYLDIDGIGRSTFDGFVFRTPKSGDTEYTEDGVGDVGWGGRVNPGDPSQEMGVTVGNSQGQSGKDNLRIKGQVLGVAGGAFRLYAAPGVDISGSFVDHPADAIEVPVVLGNLVGNHTKDAVVSGVTIKWDPATDQPCIREDASLEAFSGGDKNWVGGNSIIAPAGKAYEFKKDANSSSTTRFLFSSNRAGLAVGSSHSVERVGRGSDYTAALQWTHSEAGVADVVHMQLQGYRLASVRDPLLNVSAAGAAGTGVLAVGAFNGAPLGGMVMAEKVYAGAFHVFKDNLFVGADANIFDNTYGLIRWNSTTHKFQISTTTSAGARVWEDISGAYWGRAGSVLSPSNSGDTVSITGAGALSVTLDVITGLIRASNFLTASGGGVQANVTGSTVGFLTSNSNFLVDGNGNVSMAGDLNILGRYQLNGTTLVATTREATFKNVFTETGGGFNAVVNGANLSLIGFLTSNSNFLVDGNGNISASGTVNILGQYRFNATAGFRFSGGNLQWSNDLSTWNNFTAAGVTSLNSLTGGLSITAGTGVTITPSSPNIQVAIGQSVATSASPTFANLFIGTGGAVNVTVSGSATAFLLSNSKFLVDGNGNVSLSGDLNILGNYKLNSTTIVDTSRNATFASLTVASGGTYKHNATTIISSSRAATMASFTTESGGAFNAQVTGATVGFLTSNSNFLVDGNGNLSMTGDLNCVGNYKQNGTTVINTSRVFVGSGVDCPSNGVRAAGFNPRVSGVDYNGQNVAVGFNAATNKLTYNGADVTTVDFKVGVLCFAT